jgi:hypothetical protein
VEAIYVPTEDVTIFTMYLLGSDVGTMGIQELLVDADCFVESQRHD